jgi:hydroxypyruvate reductase
MRGQGVDPELYLRRMISYPALDAAQALLKTGPTGTNVMDVVAAYIAPGIPALSGSVTHTSALR